MVNSHAEVLSHTQLHERLWKLELIADHGPTFLAGQYISWMVDGQYQGPFSIASAPHKLPVLTFYSRHPFTPSAEKARIELSPAKGAMIAADSNIKYVFCAGGTGITPFISLRQSLILQNRSYALLWSMTDCSDKMMLEEKDREIVYHNYLSEPAYTELLKDYVGKLDHHFYVAGPMPFVRLVVQWLLSAGVTTDRIFSDMLDPRKLSVNA